MTTKTQQEAKIQRGQRVRVYRDPVTKRTEEGVAVATTFHSMTLHGNKVHALAECYYLCRAPMMGIGEPMSHGAAEREVYRLAADTDCSAQQIAAGIRKGRHDYLTAARKGRA